MKKFLTFALAGMTVMSAFAQTVTAPTCTWANLVYGETSAGDQGLNNCIATDGNIYWQLIAGTTHDQRDIYYAGSILFEGSDYADGGTSNNGNLAILKTDKNGNLLWKAYTNVNDYSQQGGVTAMPDGAVAFTANVRCTDFGTEVAWEPITIVDGKGVEHKFNWGNKSTDTKRYHMLIVGYLSADGSLEWLRTIEADRTPYSWSTGAQASGISQAIKTGSGAITSDTEGNFYFGINYRTETTIEGWTSTLVPTNIKNWAGDPQTNVGDVAVIKYNSKGEVVKVLTCEGSAEMENIISINYFDGYLYGGFYFRGNGSELNLGGKTFTVQGVFSPTLVKMDTDFNIQWINSLRGEKYKNNFGYQNTSVFAKGDNIFWVGQFNGSFYENGNETPIVESVTPSTREGYIIKMENQTGKCLAGRTSIADGYDTKLTGYFDAFEAPEDETKIYVYGYCLLGNPACTFLRCYNTVDLSSDKETEWRLVTGATMPSAISMAYDSETGRLYTMTRGKGSFNTLNGPTAAKATNTWEVLLNGYDMPKDFQTDVNCVIANQEDRILVNGTYGALEILNNGEAATVAIYDFSGRCVANVTAEEGVTTISLPAGFYIAAGKKVLVK